LTIIVCRNNYTEQNQTTSNMVLLITERGQRRRKKNVNTSPDDLREKQTSWRFWLQKTAKVLTIFCQNTRARHVIKF